MVEELETECPRAPRMTVAEIVGAAAGWAIIGAAVALAWLGDALARREAQGHR